MTSFQYPAKSHDEFYALSRHGLSRERIAGVFDEAHQIHFKFEAIMREHR